MEQNSEKTNRLVSSPQSCRGHGAEIGLETGGQQGMMPDEGFYGNCESMWNQASSNADHRLILQSSHRVCEFKQPKLFMKTGLVGLLPSGASVLELRVSALVVKDNHYTVFLHLNFDTREMVLTFHLVRYTNTNFNQCLQSPNTYIITIISY